MKASQVTARWAERIGRTHSAALIAVVLLTTNVDTAAAAASCKLAKLGDLPVHLVNNLPILDGSINGHRVAILLDTGVTTTSIRRSTAVKLGLSVQTVQGNATVSAGGASDVEFTTVDEFKIGDASRRNWQVAVTGQDDSGGDIDVLLGDDFFHKVDVEFDLAHNSVRLYQSRDCEGVPLAYWAKEGASEAQLEPVSEARPQIMPHVLINGREIPAQLDSGRGISVLDKGEAERAGVTPTTPGVAPGPLVRGFDQKNVQSWIGPFKTVIIGDEIIRDTTLHFASLSSSPTPAEHDSDHTSAKMLLGADFLRSHRVLIAHSQRKMYFTYAGGPVFQSSAAQANAAQSAVPQSTAPARTPVDLRPQESGTDPERAIAEANEVIRGDPLNAKALATRGQAWYAKKNYALAIADYSAAILIDPRDARAFDSRGRAYLASGNFDRAISDFDAAIRIDPRQALTFADRGVARLYKGQSDQGIADLTHAIELDPKFARAYVVRGDAKQQAGDPAGAIADYSRATEVDPELATAYNLLAWILATSEVPSKRNGPRAVESALKACELSQWKDPDYVNTLAAAYARVGQFSDATKWQRKALEDPRLATNRDAQARLRLYQENKAWPPD